MHDKLSRAPTHLPGGVSVDLENLLRRSRATEAFKRDVEAFERHEPSPRVQTSRPSPRVKVLRVLCQLLHAHPDLEIERIHLEGWSGCSDFVGVIRVEAAGMERAFRFVWCCQWRAQQEGWFDYFGLPDQIRAAREFGWQCFSEWRELPGSVAAARLASDDRLEGMLLRTYPH